MKCQNLPTYGDEEYTPIPPNRFPTIHGEDPLWTLNNVASIQVSDWFRLDGAKVVVLIEREVSHKAERAASLADALAKDINKNFKITGTKAIYGYVDFTANSKRDEPLYTFCVFNLPKRVAQLLISSGMWRSKRLHYTCFPLGRIPQTFVGALTKLCNINLESNLFTLRSHIKVEWKKGIVANMLDEILQPIS